MSKFQQLSQREHIIKKPNMYIGSLSTEEVKKYILDDNKFTLKKISYNPALFKIIDEAILEANQKNIHGKEVTPFLLSKIVDKTGGYSLKANIALLSNQQKR